MYTIQTALFNNKEQNKRAFRQGIISKDVALTNNKAFDLELEKAYIKIDYIKDLIKTGYHNNRIVEKTKEAYPDVHESHIKEVIKAYYVGH